MSTQPVVSFGGPMLDAGRAIDVAYDLFERRRFGEGIEQLKVAQVAIAETVEFILKTHPEAP